MKEKSIKEKFLTPNGYILSCLADNTSALSWMCHASRSRSFPIPNLAQFFVTLLFHANYLFPLDCWKVYIRENLAKIPQQTADIFREAFVSSDAQPLVISSIFDDITDDGN